MKKGEKESLIAKEKNRLWHFGRKLSDETKRKISLKKIGCVSPMKGKHYKMSEETKKKISLANQGKKLSSETRLKISLSKTGKKRPDMVGSNNKSWLGGRYTYFKNKALIRDNYTCQKCGFSDKNIMIVDHIKPKSIYPELELDINNLMTLCPNCNATKTLNDIKKYQTGRRVKEKWKI
jgi:hypothetical protein